MTQISGGTGLKRTASAHCKLVAVLLVSASFAGVGSVDAQETAPMTWLDTITLVGTRTELAIKDNPRSVAVIDAKEIERHPTDSVAELLRDIPGVEVSDESVAGMKRLRIRGESSRRVTILVDGQEITDHSTYGTPILVDPYTIERIEVVKGPSSVLYGAKAIGGVVNITTKKGADKPIQFEAGGSYFSGSKGWQSWAAVSGSKSGFDYRLSASTDRHGNRIVPEGIYSSTGTLDDTSYNNRDLYAHLGYRFGESDNHYLSLKLEQHRLESEGWTGIVAPPIQRFKIDLPKRDLRKVGIYYDGEDISDTIRKIHVDAYYQTIDRLFRNEVTVSPMPRRTVDATSTSDDRIIDYGMNAQIDLDLWTDHQTIFGLQYLSDNLVTDKTSATVMTGFGPFPIRSNSASRDKAHIDTFSAYAQDTWDVTEDLKFISGLRLSHIRTALDESSDVIRAEFKPQNDTRLLSSFGVTWAGLDPVTLRASYSEGYITPTLLQLFSSTTAGGQGTIFGNPELESETARNFEIGARYEDRGLTFDLGAFYTKSKDYITTTPCLTVTDYCLNTGTSSVYTNADRASSYGLEFLVSYELAATGFTPYFGGSWMRRELEYAKFSTYNSDTPPLSGRLGVRYEGEVQRHPFWTDLYMRGATSNKQTYLDTSGLVTENLPSLATLNFAFGGSFGENEQLTFAVDVNNIFNKEYRPTFGELPGVGRSIVISARVKF